MPDECTSETCCPPGDFTFLSSNAENGPPGYVWDEDAEEWVPPDL